MLHQTEHSPWPTYFSLMIWWHFWTPLPYSRTGSQVGCYDLMHQQASDPYCFRDAPAVRPVNLLYCCCSESFAVCYLIASDLSMHIMNC